MLFRSKRLLEERWGKMMSARADLEATTARRAGFARNRKRSQQSRVKVPDSEACKRRAGRGEVEERKNRKIRPGKCQPEMQGEEKARESWIRITRFNKESSLGMERRRTSTESREQVKMNLRE